MKFAQTLCIFVLTVLPLASFAAGGAINAIGLYFDDSGDTVCMANGLSEIHTVYLIVKNPMTAGGIGGWQGTLHVDAGLSVFGAVLSGDALNVGSGNDYIVGLGTPLPWAQSIILAQFSVYATSPGGIRFDRLEGDIYDGPAIADGGTGYIFVTNLEFGGEGVGPSLTIGTEDCPVPNTIDGAPSFNQSSLASPSSINELVVEYISSTTYAGLGVADETYSETVWSIEYEGNQDFAFYTSGAAYNPSRINPDLVAGDFNGDSISDRYYVCPNNFPFIHQVAFAHAISPGVYQTATGYPTGTTNPDCIAEGDFDNDTYVDVVVAGATSNSVGVLFGDGTGALSAPVNFAAGGVRPADVAAIDCNLDGNLDVLVVNRDSDSISIFLGNGDRTFQATAITTSVGDAPNAVAVAWVDNDIYPDVAVTNGGDNTVSLLLSNGDGTFSSATGSPVSVYGLPSSVCFGYFNYDNHIDLAVSNQSSQSITVLIGDGLGEMLSPTTYGVTYSPHGIVAHDFDLNGLDDIVVGCYDIGVGANIEYFFNSATPSAVSDRLPGTLSLNLVNFPNPFNPSTEIRFDLPKAAYTQVAIFDLTGRVVSRLLAEHLAEGPHQVEWAGDDENGRAVASGVYLAVVDVDGSRHSTRLTLCK